MVGVGVGKGLQIWLKNTWSF